MDVTKHLRHNLVAYLALFVALSGTSYAAAKLPTKSVGSKQLKSSAVTSVKVKDGSLLGQDFKAGELPVGKTGPAGSQGPQGSRGPQGAAGSAGGLVGQSNAPSSNPGMMPDGSVIATANLDLPRDGKLYVYAHALMHGYCDSENVQLGLWLDNVGVPGTKRVGDDAAPGVSLEPAAVTSNSISAGTHTLTLRARCTGSEVPAEHGSGEYTAGAILLSP